MNWMQIARVVLAVVGMSLSAVLLWCCLAISAKVEDEEGTR